MKNIDCDIRRKPACVGAVHSHNGAEAEKPRSCPSSRSENP